MGMKLGKGGAATAEGQPEQGMHDGRIVAVIAAGTTAVQFENEPPKDKFLFNVVFELPDEKDDKGFNKVVSKLYPFSKHPKSGLYKLCVAALGACDEDTDIEELVNKVVGVNIVHSEAGYAKIESVTALRPQQAAKVGEADNVPFYWDFECEDDYVDCDFVPWVFHEETKERVKMGEMIARSRERSPKTKPQQAAPRQQQPQQQRQPAPRQQQAPQQQRPAQQRQQPDEAA